MVKKKKQPKNGYLSRFTPALVKKLPGRMNDAVLDDKVTD
jgi:hypothetical protein